MKKTFDKYINKNSWMNDNTRASLLQELRTTLIVLGGESKYWNRNLILPYLQVRWISLLTLSSHDFIEFSSPKYNKSANYLETIINATRRIKDLEYAHFNYTEDTVLR